MSLPLVAIVGRPNVGKSTLYNKLVGGRPALVHDTPGLTRDRRYGTCDYFGRAFRVVDTGGLDPEAEAEVIGAGIHRQAERAIAESDLIAFVVDGKAGVSPLDAELGRKLRSLGKPLLLVVNKIDHAKHDLAIHEFHRLGFPEVLAVSAAHGRGVDDFMSRLVELLELPAPPPPPSEDERLRLEAQALGEEDGDFEDEVFEDEEGAEGDGDAEDDAEVEDDAEAEDDADAEVEDDADSEDDADADSEDDADADAEDDVEADADADAEDDAEDDAEAEEDLEADGEDEDEGDSEDDSDSWSDSDAASRSRSRRGRAPRPARDEALAPLRIAFVGRPNAGKSSLCNRLIGQERSLVHHVAGTTTDPVDSELTIGDRKYILVDTAGIRRKAKVEAEIEKIAVSMSLGQIERADVVVLLLDAAAGPSEQDARIAGMIEDHGKALILAVNKADLVPAAKKREALTEALRDTFHFLPWAPVVWLSAARGDGVDRLLDKVDQVARQYRRRIGTSELNRFFAEVCETMPPPMWHGKSARVYYLTQGRAAPPTFLLWTNNAQGLPPTYRRFIANRLRERYGFGGTPLRVIAKPKSEKAGEASAPRTRAAGASRDPRPPRPGERSRPARAKRPATGAAPARSARAGKAKPGRPKAGRAAASPAGRATGRPVGRAAGRPARPGAANAGRPSAAKPGARPGAARAARPGSRARPASAKPGARRGGKR